jgi:hypothetical protein
MDSVDNDFAQLIAKRSDSLKQNKTQEATQAEAGTKSQAPSKVTPTVAEKKPEEG